LLAGIQPLDLMLGHLPQTLRGANRNLLHRGGQYTRPVLVFQNALRNQLTNNVDQKKRIALSGLVQHLRKPWRQLVVRETDRKILDYCCCPQQLQLRLFAVSMKLQFALRSLDRMVTESDVRRSIRPNDQQARRLASSGDHRQEIN
jgi:hypothetical protein